MRATPTLVPTLLAIALIGFALPAEAAPSNDHWCQGFSPVHGCSLSGTLACCGWGLYSVPYTLTTAAVHVQFSTATGTVTVSCTYVAGLPYGSCSSSTSGYFVIGQLYTLSGWATGVGVAGISTLPAGWWEAHLLNPY